MPLSELNLKEIPSPIMKGIVFDGEVKSDKIAPMLINLQSLQESIVEKFEIPEEKDIPAEENQFLSKITQNRFNNIRVFTNSMRIGSEEKIIESEEYMRKLELLKRGERRDNFLKMIEAVKKIQRFYRKKLLSKRILIKKDRTLLRKVSTIKKKGDAYVWLKIINDLKRKSHCVYANFFENARSELNLSKSESITKKMRYVSFKIDIPKELALKILDSHEPFIWVTTLYKNNVFILKLLIFLEHSYYFFVSILIIPLWHLNCIYILFKDYILNLMY